VLAVCVDKYIFEGQYDVERAANRVSGSVRKMDSTNDLKASMTTGSDSPIST
jgi:hypothetical protein